jgi:diaminohydroxyphosphoribosylaminopyrimidine deaminase/5-amino-6-(5-phosphoribosylamino)uracil reductase
VWPNPSVGCVIVRDGLVVGRGWTRPGGRPHGETEALRRAGPKARGATAYVALEPCSHYGKTPPCADALVDAGIARVVVALEDPDPRVAGRGMACLRDAGVEAAMGLHADQAQAVNAGFFMRVSAGRPLFTLKTATTLDGRIATAAGESQWITGEAARQRGHLLRASHDAIMVGIGTVLADDPSLVCRLPGLGERSPVRVVVDRHLQLPSASRLAATATTHPTWVLTLAGGDTKRRDELSGLGVRLIDVADDDGGLVDLNAAAAALGDAGLTRVLVEGGARLSASMVRRGLADRLTWFRNARLIGGDGLPAMASLGVEALGDAPAWRRLSISLAGDDVMETYERIA